MHWRLFRAFTDANNRTLRHDQIVDRVWGDTYSPSEGRVRGLISELRTELRQLLNLPSNPLPSVDASAWRLDLD